jgi:hypothetical protein
MPSELQRIAVSCAVTDVSEEQFAFIFKADMQTETVVSYGSFVPTHQTTG